MGGLVEVKMSNKIESWVFTWCLYCPKVLVCRPKQWDPNEITCHKTSPGSGESTSRELKLIIYKSSSWFKSLNIV